MVAAQSSAYDTLDAIQHHSTRYAGDQRQGYLSRWTRITFRPCTLRWCSRSLQGRSDQLIRFAFRSTRAQMRGSRRSAIVILWPRRETRQICPCGRNPGGAGPLRPSYRVAPRSLATHLFALGQLRSVRLVREHTKAPKPPVSLRFCPTHHVRARFRCRHQTLTGLNICEAEIKKIPHHG